MNLNKINTLFLSIVVSLGTASTAAAQANDPASSTQQPAQQQQQGSSKKAELEEAFRSISTKVQQIEMQAVETEEVSKEKSEFDKLVRENVVEKDPDLAEAVKKRAEYREQIEEVQMGEVDPKEANIREVYSEYNKLHQKIMPVEQEVMNEPKVQEAYQEYRSSLLETMKEIDPQVMQYISRQQEIREKYEKLMRSQQGQRGG